MSAQPLRVAIVSPPWYTVPPDGYGGIELVIFVLARELTAMGQEVTVFGRQGPMDGFELIALSPESWSAALGGEEHLAREATYVRRAYDVVRHRAFDVVHDHSGYLGIVAASLLDLQSARVATLHGGLGEADGVFLSSVDKSVELVAISQAQQGLVAGVRWAGVVHNAVPADDLELGIEPKGYLVELARISPDKGQHLAIEIARRAGKKLILAGKVDEADRGYFESEIQPHLGESVEWIENVAGRDKARLLAGADALLFPIQWEEPFGLAMVESMASGTPVVATPRGAANEIVEEGVTGFLGRDVDELVATVGRVGEVDRRRCAEIARDRFGGRRMAEGYLEVYRASVERRREQAWR